MTVAELIEELKVVDPSRVVLVHIVSDDGDVRVDAKLSAKAVFTEFGDFDFERYVVIQGS